MKPPQFPHFSLAKGLVPSRVSGIQSGVITTEGDKALPFIVVRVIA